VASERVERRLAAIFAADMVGYSRLMEVDEEGVIARQKKHHKELIDPKIAEHHGRIVKLMGDGVLVEFASVVDAVRCAVELQQAMVAREADVPEERRIRYRVGVNLGDIVIDGDDILGDGVNVAARLEGLAEPGGICFSGDVYRQVEGKLDFAFEDKGEQTVKNIKKPVHVYAIRPQGEATPAIDVSAPVPGFGGRPAIAVLPFDNLSGDPNQEYFADGIVEDIITRLSMWRWIPVIARNSTFSYKGRAVKVQQVAKELGTRYILEGSVRKSGDRIRIAAQLIDAETGHHVWAERYDRELDDIFDLQDEITDTIVTELEAVVGKAETRRAHAKRPENLDAWDTALRAIWHFGRATRDDQEEALRLFRASLALEPNLSIAWGNMAFTYYFQMLQGWSSDPAKSVGQFVQAGQMAISLDDRDPMANAAAGYGKVLAGKPDAALVFLERAIELNPSFVIGYISLGAALILSGRPEEGAERLETAVRLSPNDFLLHAWLGTLSRAYYQAKEYEKALESARKSLQISENYPMGHHALCSALAMLGQLDEAKAALARFLELSPGYTLQSSRATFPFRDEGDFQHYFEGLRRAGWSG
jgi:adenylate cyclase